LQQALRRQFSQVAADCVFGEPQFLAQFLGNNLARPPEHFENKLLAVAGKHIATIAYSSAWVHEITRSCTKKHELVW
jgi:hypothetical protein